MTTDWIFGWWNLVFLAPFLLALIYLGVYAASGVTFGDVDADADFGADADVDHDMHVGGDAGHDAHIGGDAHGHDVGHGHGHGGHHAPSGRGGYLAALTWLGVGRVPLSIVMMVLLMTFGAIGFATNVLTKERFAEDWQPIVFSLPLAFVGSLVLTGGISTAIGKLVPLNETSARRRHELLGSIGDAMFSIDEVSGVVCVRDDHGDLFQVACRVESGVTPIAKGERVKLTAYDANKKLFYAVPVNRAESAATAPATT